jgi:PAS domain S-box-containing protein
MAAGLWSPGVFTEFMANNPTAIVLVGLSDGVIFDVNSAYERLLLYSREELVGRTIRDLGIWEDASHRLHYIEALSISGAVEGYACRLRRKDGQVRDMVLNGSIVHGPASSALIASVVQDVTERLRLQRVLEESEQRYRSITSAVTDYIYTVHIQDGAVVKTEHSAMCEAVTGYRPEDFDRDPYLWFTMVLEEDRDLVREHFNRVMAGERLHPIEHRIRRKDGTVRWVSNMPVIHRDAHGAVTGYEGVLGDITDRKTAEIELRESEERFRILQEASFGGIGIHDKGLILDCNMGLERVTGYSREELVGMDGLKLIEPGWRAIVMERILGAYELPYDVLGLRKDGSTYPLEIQGKQIPYHGRTVRVTEFRDITARKLAEEALRASEERYRLMAELTGKIVYDFGLDAGRYVWNGAVEEITGYTAEELESMDMKDWTSMIHPDDRAALIMTFEKVLGTQGPFRAEYRIRRKDGDLVHVEDHGVFIMDASGRPCRMLGSIGDITERKLAEEALRQSEERLRLILMNIADIVIILDAQGRITYQTPSTARILGYAPGLLTGTSPVDLVHPDDRDGVSRDLAEVYEGMSDGRPTEFRCLKADGTWVHLEAIGARIDEPQGPGVVVITARDITDRRKAQELRIGMERRMLNAQRMESLGVLAGGIAHDFNNLLMAIMGNIDLAKMDVPPASKATALLDRAMVSARRAAELTNHLLAYSGRGKSEQRALDLNAIVEEAARLSMASVPKTVNIDIRLSRGLPPVKADPGQIQQVVMNLVANASEAIGEARGHITVKTDLVCCTDEHLAASLLPDKPPAGEYVMLEVSDTGCGMDADTVDLLLDPFFTTKFPGRGLGMAAVRGIVAGHRGAIMVASRPGEGTTVQVLLPSAGMPEERGVQGASPRGEDAVVQGLAGYASVAEGSLVLVVDDEDLVRTTCASMVERLGRAVITASDGVEALEVLKDNPGRISCVILDLTMPVMDGLETLAGIRRLDDTVKVILSSGYDEQEAASRFEGIQAAGFIRKPYTLEQLRRAIEAVLAV